MGKQCIVIAVLFPVLENRHRSTTLIPGLTKNPRCGIDVLILDVCEALPESYCAKPICAEHRRQWAGRIRTRISAGYSKGLVFLDSVARNRVQVNVVIFESRDYLVNRGWVGKIRWIRGQARVE